MRQLTPVWSNPGILYAYRLIQVTASARRPENIRDCKGRRVIQFASRYEEKFKGCEWGKTVVERDREREREREREGADRCGGKLNMSTILGKQFICKFDVECGGCTSALRVFSNLNSQSARYIFNWLTWRFSPLHSCLIVPAVMRIFNTAHCFKRAQVNATFPIRTETLTR